ncbi:MAG: hypothetical protein EAZ89_11475, partial [Bacteroidetes bacterium]
MITSLVLPVSALRGQFLSWSYENILTDARQSGANPDLFTDAAGNFHVSYWHAGTDKLVYARRSKATGQWSIEYVPDNGGYGFKSAIILDNAGTIHIAYHHNNLGQATLRYAKKQAGQWTITNLFADASIGTYGSDPNFPGNVQHSLDITLRADGLPSILFFNGKIFSVTPCTGVDLTYSSYQLDLNTLNLLPSGQWQHHEFANVPYNGNTGCLNSGDRFGEFCQFIKGAGNQYYALANSLHNHELLLFESNPATTLNSWTANRLDSVARLFGPTSVAYFREGYDHIASSQQGDSIVHIVYGLTNFYGASPSFPGRETFIYARVHLDSIHVAGYHPFYHTFSPLNVSRSYYSITYTDGAPIFITYYNRQSGAVVVAESNDQGQSWTENTLFTILTNTSLKSEIVGDSLFVLHYDAIRDGMGLSARSLSGSTWVHQTATRTEVNGLDFSSAIQRTPGGDKIHIAFTETASDQLYYGLKEGGTWDFDPVDVAGKEAGSVATGITPQGNPVLAYVQEADETLKFARKNAGNWTFQTIDISARPREVVMRMVGDSVHICYFDRLQGALKYARSNGSAPWIVTVLDSSSQIMGRLPSIEADASGNLHLSYQDALNSRLRYAVRKNGTWTRSYITQPV